MNSIRIGIVGFGFMGKTHAASVLKNFQTDLAFLVDQNSPVETIEKNVGNLQNKMLTAEDIISVPWFKNLDEALQQCPCDAVVLSVPTSLHKTMGLQILHAGKHLFLEKPMALSVEDCQILTETAKKAGKILFVGHVMQFSNFANLMRNLLQTRKYGALQELHLTRFCGKPGWWTHSLEAATTGGGIMDLLIHDINLSYSLLGFPEHIEISPCVRKNWHPERTDAFLIHKNGVITHISGGWMTQFATPFFSQSKAIFENAVVISDTSGITVSQGHELIKLELQEEDSYYNEMAAFIDSLKSGTENVLCSGEAATASIREVFRIING